MAVPSEEQTAGATLDALADAARALAAATSLREAATALAAAVGRAVGAGVVVARVAEESDAELPAVGVFSSSAALAAQVEGSHVSAADLPEGEVDEVELLPEAVRRAAERARLHGVFLVPVRLEAAPTASLELLRAQGPLDEEERQVARLVAYQLAAAARAFRGPHVRWPGDGALALAGEALAAASDATRTPEQVARLAADATAASSALLWRVAGAAPELVSAYGIEGAENLGTTADAAARALGRRAPVTLEEGEFPGGAAASVTLQLGQPVIGALQLLFRSGTVPEEAELPRLATFGVRAAHALRASMNARTLALDLERTRAVLGFVGQAIAQLSLAHTLETAVEQTAELLGSERLAVYLRLDGRFIAAAGRGLAGPHLAVAERLLELVLGPFRARTVLVIDDVLADPHLAPIADAASEAGIEAAVAVPLLVHDELVGLLAVYPPRGRTLAENESALLAALAGQLAVAVQNANLHERTKRQEEELKAKVAEARRRAAEVQAFSEISESLAEHLSLDETLKAVARTAVQVLEVDIAVIQTPDERRELLVPRAVHASDETLVDAAATILARPQALRTRRIQRLLADHKPFLVDADTASELGRDYDLLAPFLERGWTGAVLPLHTATEVLAVVAIFSRRPEQPVTRSTLERAAPFALQAAVAIDRARLYQQQREFAETMQRSLLPQAEPELPGLDVAAEYAPSAKVDVGGDVYDFLVLPDGRLAVVVGDVTGHGVDATADMAMAKFVFRCLAREHPDPGDFLAAANEVVMGEVAAGKFITMLYLAVDGTTGAVACAGAGHPPPRLVAPDGTVRSLDARGLVLGVAAGQRYEEVRETLEKGGAVVLYTDGVVEARRDGELFGAERLDALLVRECRRQAAELAAAVLAECRAFAGGELADDVAVIVIKRV